MSWMEKLCETYDIFAGEVGVMPLDGKTPLLPIYHTTQQAQLEIALDMEGNWLPGRGRVITDKGDMTTIIPCTESSCVRSGIDPSPHPLFDGLKYIAGDFEALVPQSKNSFEKYIIGLREWCLSEYSHPAVKAVYTYLQKRRLLEDLAEDRLLYRDEEGNFPDKWTGEEDPPPIFRAVTGGQLSAFVRFLVYGSGAPTPKLWEDPTVWKSWIDYQNSLANDRDFCYVFGREVPVSRLSPRNIRRAGDGAKLISSNDMTGFTFRGRFEEAREAVSVGRETTEKAHSALRWLISRQGSIRGDQVILTWLIAADQLPHHFLTMNTGEYSSWLMLDSLPPSTGEEFAQRFKNAVRSYREKADDNTSAVVIGLDSATPGRLSIFYYREKGLGELLDRVNDWHTSCAWKHTYWTDRNSGDKKGGAKPFVGAPSPAEIAEAAYGSRVDDKLKAATTERLLPCITDGTPLPVDLMLCAARRATNAVALEPWEARKTLSIACALIRKYYGDRGRINRKEEDWKMPDESCNDRDYLFGRALACARRLEETAQWMAGNDPRQTNAERMQVLFSQHPAHAWKDISNRLLPYLNRYRRGGTPKVEMLMQDILSRIPPEDFNDKPLSPLYLLGYASQMAAFRAGTESENDEAAKQTEEE